MFLLTTVTVTPEPDSGSEAVSQNNCSQEISGILNYLNRVHLPPSTGVVGFIEVIEITLMISFLQTETLTPDLGETLCLVIQGLPPHREVGEGGEAEGEIPPVEMTFRR